MNNPLDPFLVLGPTVFTGKNPFNSSPKSVDSNDHPSPRLINSTDKNPFLPIKLCTLQPESVVSNYLLGSKPAVISDNNPFNPFPKSVDSHPFVNVAAKSVDSHPFVSVAAKPVDSHPFISAATKSVDSYFRQGHKPMVISDDNPFNPFPKSVDSRMFVSEAAKSVDSAFQTNSVLSQFKTLDKENK